MGVMNVNPLSQPALSLPNLTFQYYRCAESVRCVWICALADSLRAAGKRQEASLYYQKARKIGEAHGFFSVECRACLGLGREKLLQSLEQSSWETALKT